MALKAKLSKDEHAKLSADLQAAYREKDGVFLLDAEGVVTQDEFDAQESKLAEFRDNNRALHGKLKQFDGIDPDAHRALVAESDKWKKSGVQKPDDIQAMIAAALATAQKETDERLKKIETERDQAQRSLSEKSLEDALWDVGVKAIRESARPDFLARAKRLFTFEDGKVVAKDGDKPLYSKRRGHTTDPLTIDEYVNDPDWLVKDGDHLFKTSQGSGARKNDQTVDGARVLANDPAVLGANLDAMAKGSVLVQSGA
jgi:hypothetical protein